MDPPKASRVEYAFPVTGVQAHVSDLKADLESLRRSEAPETSRKGLWILLGVVILALGGGALAWRSANAAVEVATVTPSVERTSSAPAGTPVLTASGTSSRAARPSSRPRSRAGWRSCAWKKAARYAKARLIARLESSDFVASVARAQAQVQQATASQSSADASIQRAEADVAEARRQLGVSERLIADKLVPVDQLDANKSRVKLAEAALAQARAERERTIASAAQADGRPHVCPQRSCRTP